jgi:DNA polymerase II small subunit|tara:strand:- start:836 stop:2146 length:1311 start_codon:yes stop_codon:yes gene_type:complete
MSYKKFNFGTDNSWAGKASDYPDEIIKNHPVGESVNIGSIGSIADLFHDRFEKVAELLSMQAGFKSTGVIKDLMDERKRSGFKNKTYRTVGIVESSRRTKSGGKMVTLEDNSGVMDVFIRKEDPSVDSLMNDDVIGIVGRFDKNNPNMFWVDEVQYVDVLFSHQNKGGKDFDPISIAFISDVHMGSKYFLEETWDKMMKWLNTNELAKNIKYLVLSGDTVDGAGVYPGQDNNLSITNVYEQYQFCANKLDELPNHITPIILPGNHDAVRPAEPQPVLEHSIQQKFNSAIHVGNPCRVNLNGIDMLSYHGKGMDDIIPRIEEVSYEDSVIGMKHMLKKRHLAPIWGERNALSPEEHDQMVIRTPPDIFVTGHTHSHATEWYNGVPLVVSSTMQGQTDFMQMLGYSSMKGFLTLYNIQNREFKVISFHANDDVARKVA